MNGALTGVIMLQTTLARQFITDMQGKPIAVILPIKEYNLVKNMLEEKVQEEAQMLKEMESAANDPLLLADIEETMIAFETADAEWWEPTQ